MIKMTASSTIYIAIETILGLILKDSSVLCRVEVRVTSKYDHSKSKRSFVHFLFQRPGGSYIRVLYGIKDTCLAEDIMVWTQSANNDGLQVVGYDGINRPLNELVNKLVRSFGRNAKEEDYEIDASWIMGGPEICKVILKEVKSKQKIPRRFRVSFVS